MLLQLICALLISQVEENNNSAAMGACDEKNRHHAPGLVSSLISSCYSKQGQCVEDVKASCVVGTSTQRLFLSNSVKSFLGEGTKCGRWTQDGCGTVV